MNNEPTSEPTPSTPEATSGESTATPATGNYDPKIVGIVAYITLIGWIVALIMNNPKTPFASFHIRQSLGIMLLFLVSGVVMIIPVLGWIVGLVGYVAAFVFWIMGLIGSIQGSEKPVPLIGEKAQEWFQAL